MSKSVLVCEVKSAESFSSAFTMWFSFSPQYEVCVIKAGHCRILQLDHANIDCIDQEEAKFPEVGQNTPQVHHLVSFDSPRLVLALTRLPANKTISSNHKRSMSEIKTHIFELRVAIRMCGKNKNQ